ncbi:hypothetical protein [uncultured Eubacterium sp.]|uniref:hypothetical protein n=1 Tax=uncultured Eubacterium sp. TaxID=165185 RepID=UPI00259A2076|nr:hypothetical protein [uncultured Eubacterium sp.]
MNKEEKQILLIDLSARYPYGVIIHSIWDYQELSGRIKRKETVRTMESYDFCDYWNCKPYLRPLSSMTEEEKEELIKNFWGSHTAKDTFEELSWYLSKHFDINGLIPKGLAIEVTEDNNPYKE